MSEREDCVGAVDIGGTKIAVGIVAGDGSILSQRSYSRASVTPGGAGVKIIAGGLEQCRQECGRDIAGVGIGCTGPVDPLTRVIGKVALLPGWHEYPLGAELSQRMKLEVAMENDADAAALAESLWGRGRGAERFLYVTVSTGIGAGFVIGGHLYRGARGAHPEMGHHGIDPSGPLCYCGTRGCWESLASGTALEERFLRESSSTERVAARSIFERAVAGDAIALQAVEQCIQYLGIGLANLTTMLVPDVIALGGGVVQSMTSYLPTLREFILSACREVPAVETKVETAGLQQGAGLAGAGAVAIMSLLTSPKERLQRYQVYRDIGIIGEP